MGTSSIDWAQLSKFYLKTGTESSLPNVVLKNKQDGVFDTDTTMDNVQKHNTFTNVPLSQTFRSYLDTENIGMQDDILWGNSERSAKDALSSENESAT
jgi:hypothetical protein